MKLAKICLVAISILMITINPSWAGWWSKAKDLLRSDSSKEVLSNLGSNEVVSTSPAAIDFGSALRETLSLGVNNVTNKLGAQDGFNADPQVRIALPDSLVKIKPVLAIIGQSSLLEDLELKLNRAAEAATPKAKSLFINSIRQMSVADAKNILTGSENSATQYFRKTMEPSLLTSMTPVVTDALQNTGAVQVYDSIVSKYSKIPFMPDLKANLSDYVVNEATDGIFYYMAKEEANIRTNPASRGTELLKKVFSQ